MLKTIVAALDGSSHSERAFDLACDFAVKFDANLHLVHVVTEREVPDDLRRMAEVEHLIPARLKSAADQMSESARFGSVLKNVEKAGESYQILEKLGENLLESGLQDARERGVASVKSKLLRGEPAAEIIRYIESVSADIVISGSRGLGSLRGLMVGSVSHELTQHAPCAVMMVK